MSKILKLRRGTANTMATTKANTVLAAGEIFAELPNTGAGTGKGRLVMGDGTTAYSQLPSFLENVDVSSAQVTVTADNSSTSTAAINNVSSGATTGALIGSLKQAISLTKSELTNTIDDYVSTNNVKFYFDYQNGEYGYNTSPLRGADTFSPFKGSISDIATAYSWSGTAGWGQWSTTKTFSNILSGVSKLIIPYVWYTNFTGASQQVGGVTIRADNDVLYTTSGLHNAGVIATNVYNVSGKNDLTFIFTSTYGGYFSVPNCYVV